MLERLGSLEAVRAFAYDFAHPITVTRGLTIVVANDAWLAVLGYRRDEVEGRSYLEFMPPEAQSRLRHRAEIRSKLGDPLLPTTSLAVRKDGRSTVVHITPTKIPMPEGDSLILSMLFVVPERDAEIELAELLVATASRVVGARTVRDVRERAVSHLGSGGYLAGFFHSDGTAIYPEDATLARFARKADIDEALAERRPVFAGPESSTPLAVVVPIARAEATEIFFMAGPVVSTPLHAALRLFAQGMGSALDTASLITDLERRNHELTETRAELVRHERLAALGEMSATIAHEVRNPVGVIANAVTTLRRENLPRVKHGELLSIIDEECLRLARMVRDLLDFVHARPVTLTTECLAEIAEEAISATKSQPDPTLHGVTYHFEHAADVPSVRVDRHLLRQALVNVLVNAAQASPAHGIVNVRVVRIDRGGASMSAIAVADRGPGIAASVKERIFEPFFTTRAQGTGLGLAVVRRIVDELAGEIVVDAKEGAGATFTLAFKA